MHHTQKTRKIRNPQYKGSIRFWDIPNGLPHPEDIRQEMEDMRQVLMGREEPPIEMGVATLMEVANGYFSRACEWEQLILAAKARKQLPAGYETLRTQEIRSFKELAKGATELGSRRITWEQKRREQEMRGLEGI
jgi:hypothetical protein